MGHRLGLRERNEYTYTPDSAKTIGAVTGNVGAGTHGHLVEPTTAFTPRSCAPFSDNGANQSIILKAAIVTMNTTSFPGHSTYQLGLEVDLVKELKLRGTYGTVFRAPTISELFGGLVDSFPTYFGSVYSARGTIFAARVRSGGYSKRIRSSIRGSAETRICSRKRVIR